MTRSIRVRLLVWILSLLLPLSVVAAWLLIQLFGNGLLRDTDVALEEEAETVAAVLSQPDALDARVLLDGIAGETDLGAQKYVAVQRGGSVIGESPEGAQAILDGGDPALRVLRYEAEGADPPLTVTIGVSPTAALRARRRLTSLLAVGLPAALLLVGTGLWLIIGRALRPLASAAHELDAISVGHLSTRVTVDNPDDEVGRLAVGLNRMLTRLDTAVGELQRFTADAAHELRTPLAVLRAGLEVALTRERSSAEYRTALEEALVGTERLGRLAEDLLTLARLDAAGAPRAPEPVELGTMLQELADAWEEAVAGRGLHLKVTSEPGLWARGNAGDLYRLLHNLIDNAVRHTPSGGSVDLSGRRLEDRVVLAVADTGVGLPSNDLARVFERFYRGRNEPADATGTGLGLAIAQEIARAHGGEISAANRAAGGCVFTLNLPAGPSGSSVEDRRPGNAGNGVGKGRRE